MSIAARSSAVAMSLVLGGMLSGMPGAASGQTINIVGDLGTGSITGTPSSGPNSTFTQAFTQTAGAGNITFDVIVANDITGTIFDLTITNLVYNVTALNSAGAGDVSVIVDHTYLTSSVGPYLGSHSLSGSWTSGPMSDVQVDTIMDFGGANILIPSLTATVSPFGLGPATNTAPGNSAGIFNIRAILRLHSDGLGSISLPTSYDITVQPVPEPATLSILAAAFAVGLRRRRA
jgi:hypothetical protein